MESVKKMKSFLLMCAVCLHFGGSFGQNTEGVGAFSYQDSSGKRYGGTYGLRDGQVVEQRGNFPPNFSPPDFTPPNFQDLDDFFPDYFSNLENLLQEANPFILPLPFIRPPPFRRPFSKPFFKRTFDNVDNQRLAYGAATKAFDLTSNRAGYNPNFTPSRFPSFGGNFQGFGFGGAQGFPGVQGFPGRSGFPGFDMSNFGGSENSAFAGSAITPEFKHQVAGINPANPSNPNIDKLSSVAGSPGGYKSVSSFSSVSSQDIDGQKTSSRKAETVVNDNGVITKYKVDN